MFVAEIVGSVERLPFRDLQPQKREEILFDANDVKAYVLSLIFAVLPGYSERNDRAARTGDIDDVGMFFQLVYEYVAFVFH